MNWPPWLPPDTMPKEGRFLVKDQVGYVEIWQWVDGSLLDETFDRPAWDAVGWLPLPL